MSIPTEFNPMGAGVCGEPATVYKDFVQPVLLSNTTIDRTKPYSFGMSITDDDGNATAWQAFDGETDSAWIFAKPTNIIRVKFEHPVLLDTIEVSGWVNKSFVVAFRAQSGTEVLFQKSPTQQPKTYTLKTPTEVSELILVTAVTSNTREIGVYEINFIGKYNAIYDNAE